MGSKALYFLAADAVTVSVWMTLRHLTPSADSTVSRNAAMEPRRAREVCQKGESRGD